MRPLKRGQAALRYYQDGIKGDICLVERAFSHGPPGMAEAMQKLKRHMGEAAA